MTSTTIENTSVDGSLNIDELTTASLTGTGVFDVLLQTLRLHLDREFKDGRITGTAYATVYSQALSTFLEQSIGYCLSKAKLALELQQMQEQVELLKLQQAQTEQQTRNLLSEQTRIDAEVDKVFYETAYILPEQVKVTKLTQDQLLAQNNKLATETVIAIKQGHLTDAQTCQVQAETNQINATVATKLPQEVELIRRNQDQVTAQTAVVTYELESKLPEEVELIKRNQTTVTNQNAILVYELNNVKPKEAALIQAQVDAQDYTTTYKLPEEVELVRRSQLQTTAQTDEITYRTTTLMPVQVASTEAQTAQVVYTTEELLPKQVLKAQAEVDQTDQQTALYAQKTLTELAQTTTTPAVGSVMGTQNALMEKQANNFLRDAEQKAAKMLIETWSVRRNADPSGNPVDSNNKLGDAYIGTAVAQLFNGLGISV